MNFLSARDYLDWLWLRLKEEPELEKALDDMPYIRRVVMEREVLEELLEELKRIE